MIQYDETYQIEVKQVYDRINKLADKKDTLFEYVMRDLYNYHFDGSWR